MITLKITDHKVLTQYSPAKVQFFRIDPEDLSATLENILRALMDLPCFVNENQIQGFQNVAFLQVHQEGYPDNPIG